MNKSLAVEVVKPLKLVNVPKLKGGDDEAVANSLVAQFATAQNGMRGIIALGLFAWEVKETMLDHGEWGPWLAANAPGLSRIDSSTGKPKASTAFNGFMQLTKGVLEGVGFKTIGKYLATSAKFPTGREFAHGGFLLIDDKKVPDEIKPLREKIFALVDGKTQKALFMEFKQADEDSNTPKRGRLKGSSGLTKEQRERATARAEQERLNELEEWAVETTGDLLDYADGKHLGMLDNKVLVKLQDAADTVSGFIKRVLEARKGGAK